MPDARYSFERIDFVATVKKAHFLDCGDLPGEIKLLGLEFIMILAGLHESFQKGPVRDANLRSGFELGNI